MKKIVFILWGSYAISKKALLNNPHHLIITSPHPSPLSAYRGFFGSKPFSKTNEFLKKNIVMVVAFVAALVTSVIVPVDSKYLGYFDFKTLTCLFCVLVVVCALKNIKFFYILAQQIVQHFKTARMSILALVYITFIGSMLIANDMALLTFLPLGFLVLETTGKRHYMAFTFIMQNIAANLGGMLTPFGNPQNLFLYSRFNIPTLDFMKVINMDLMKGEANGIIKKTTQQDTGL